MLCTTFLDVLKSDFAGNLDRFVTEDGRDVILLRVLSRQFPGSVISVPATRIARSWLVKTSSTRRLSLLDHPRVLNNIRMEFIAGAKTGRIAIITEEII